MDEPDEPQFSSDSSSEESSESTLTSEEVGEDTEAQFKAAMDDELAYVYSVRDEFGADSKEYLEFIGLMEDVKTRRIDIMQMISRVKVLFKEHQELLVGFNLFLRSGYKLCNPLQDDSKKSPFQDAIDFVNKIRIEFLHDEGSYVSFLNIMKEYRLKRKSFDVLHLEMCVLFRDRPHLLERFRHFLRDLPKSENEQAVSKSEQEKKSGK